MSTEFGPPESNVSHTNDQEFIDDQTLSEFGRFTTMRYAANIEWFSGIGIGLAASQLDRPLHWGIAVATGVAVTKLEIMQSDYAAAKKQNSNNNETEAIGVKYRTLKELGSLASSMWQGAGATVEVNDSFGLPNTSKRRKIQAAAYGTAVAGWTSPIATETGEFALNEAISNPLRSTVITLAGSVIGFAGLKVLRVFSRPKTNEETAAK